MNVKTMILGGLIGLMTLCLGYEYGWAESQADSAATVNDNRLNIGVVNIRKVFRDCKSNARYRADALAEKSRWDADEEKLQKQIDAQKAGLKALKPGSDDYLKQYQQLLLKQAELEAQKQFHQQQRTLKDQKWTEELYLKVLKIIAELAAEKKLALVLEQDQPQFPSVSPDELMLTLSTHKVLYSGGCLDITDEVTKRLDAEK